MSYQQGIIGGYFLLACPVGFGHVPRRSQFMKKWRRKNQRGTWLAQVRLENDC